MVEGVLEPLSAECRGICSESCVEGDSEVLAELLPVDVDDWWVSVGEGLLVSPLYQYLMSVMFLLQLMNSVCQVPYWLSVVFALNLLLKEFSSLRQSLYQLMSVVFVSNLLSRAAQCPY